MRLKSFVPCLAVLAFVGCNEPSRATAPAASATTPAVTAPASAVAAPATVVKPVVEKAATAAVAAVLKPGLLAEYYDLAEEVSDFPVIAAGTKPAVSRVDATINIEDSEDEVPGTTLSEHFYIRWTGVVRVPKDGTYTFTINSDDGSRVFIDDKEVIDHGGVHAMEEKSEDVTLTAGDHKIKVEFFENEGGAGCILMWSAAGVDQVVVPATALFH
jgi:fibro-slime domain-containing protein